MRILILANDDFGLYRFRKELITELLKEHEVFISLPGGEWANLLVREGCFLIDTPLDRRGINPMTDLMLLYKYGNIMKTVKPGLVITYTIKPNIYGGLACRRRGIPYAANITGLGMAFEKEGLLKTLVTALYRPALKKSRVVFAENSSIKEELIRNRIVGADRIRVLNGAGVNLDYFSYKEYPHNNVFSFLFIGRIMRAKGIEELLEAVRRLNKEGCKCVLHLVGDMEEDYREEIVRDSVQGLLIDHGPQKDVRPFIAAADCFVLPSWHEGMANTNLECASSGRPIITSNIPGCREAVKDGKSGLLCESRDVDGLCSAMRHMMHLSWEERANMGLAGRRLMEKEFDKNLVVKETIRWLF